jgi:hypothetical protein
VRARAAGTRDGLPAGRRRAAARAALRHLEDAVHDRDDQHRLLRSRLRRAGGRRRRRPCRRLALVRGRARRSRPSGVALALPTLPETEPPNRGLRFDGGAIVLGLASTVLAFLAVSRLQEISFASAFFVALLSGGVVGLLALLVLEYRSDEPLSPVKPLSSAIPTVGCSRPRSAAARS